MLGLKLIRISKRATGLPRSVYKIIIDNILEVSAPPPPMEMSTPLHKNVLSSVLIPSTKGPHLSE